MLRIPYYGAVVSKLEKVSKFLNEGHDKLNKGDLYGAIIDYSNVVEIDPQNAEAFYCRGCAKDEAGDFEGALEDYNKALEIDPDLSKAHCCRGQVKIMLNDFKGASEDFLIVKEKMPENDFKGTLFEKIMFSFKDEE